MIFSLREPRKVKDYMMVYMQGGELVCAPYGIDIPSNPIVTIKGFSQNNTDSWGWWHVTCSVDGGQRVRMTAYNTQVNFVGEKVLYGNSLMIPAESMIASFGRSLRPEGAVSNFFIKEVRIWSNFLLIPEIENWRYRQVDPTKTGSRTLQSYFRLASGTTKPYNLAQNSPNYNFTNTAAVLTSATLLEDSQTKTEYVLVPNTLATYLPVEVPTYHTVCPLYTYFSDFYCYSDPINQLKLTVLPSLDPRNNTLFWTFSVSYSSAIDQKLMQMLLN